MFECDFLHSLIIMSDYWYASINYTIPCRPIYIIIRKLYLVCLHILLLAGPLIDLNWKPLCATDWYNAKLYSFIQISTILEPFTYTHVSFSPFPFSKRLWLLTWRNISVIQFWIFITNNSMYLAFFICRSKNILISLDIKN